MPTVEIDFPAWWVRTKLSTIRNRCSYSLGASKSESVTSYTWAMCYNKARNKIRWRKDNPEAKAGKDEWISLIAHLRAKLKTLYELPDMWRLAEYRILEKVNKQEFTRREEPGCLWNYVAVSLANKANDKRALNRKYRGRAKNDKYNNIYGNFRARIRGKVKLTDEAWCLCFSANYGKLRDRARKNTWVLRINANYAKVIKMCLKN